MFDRFQQVFDQPFVHVQRLVDLQEVQVFHDLVDPAVRSHVLVVLEDFSGVFRALHVVLAQDAVAVGREEVLHEDELDALVGPFKSEVEEAEDFRDLSLFVQSHVFFVVQEDVFEHLDLFVVRRLEDQLVVVRKHEELAGSSTTAFSGFLYFFFVECDVQRAANVDLFEAGFDDVPKSCRTVDRESAVDYGLLGVELVHQSRAFDVVHDDILGVFFRHARDSLLLFEFLRVLVVDAGEEGPGVALFDLRWQEVHPHQVVSLFFDEVCHVGGFVELRGVERFAEVRF